MSPLTLPGRHNHAQRTHSSIKSHISLSTMANTPRLGTFLVTHHALALLGCFFLFARHRCASRSKTFEARPFRSPTIALSPRMPPYCRHGCKFMAVPRGFSNGFPGLTAMPPRPVGRLMRTATNESEERPDKAACAAETGRPLPLFSRPLMVEADARCMAKMCHDDDRPQPRRAHLPTFVVLYPSSCVRGRWASPDLAIGSHTDVPLHASLTAHDWKRDD